LLSEPCAGFWRFLSLQSAACCQIDAVIRHSDKDSQEIQGNDRLEPPGTDCPQPVLDQEFHVDQPNEVWTSDLTYIRTAAGWQYLTVILELFNREIIGYSLCPRLTTESTVNVALDMAVLHRQPPAGVILHSDRGVQQKKNTFCSGLSLARGVHDALSTINRFGFLNSPFFPYKLKAMILRFSKNVIRSLKPPEMPESRSGSRKATALSHSKHEQSQTTATN